MVGWCGTNTYAKLKNEMKLTYRYSYDNGSPEYKKYYRAFFYAMLHYEDTVKLPLEDLLVYEKVYMACVTENPLLFYIDTVVFSMGSFGVIAQLRYSADRYECENIFSKIFPVIYRLRQECATYDDCKKEECVHRYLVKNVCYDLNDSLPVHSGHSVFVHGKAVCDGISKAAKILLDGLGVKSLIVSGSSSHTNTLSAPGEGHAWNIVWVDNEPFHVDFTFDCNLTNQKDVIRFDYFNLTDEQIKKDHSYDDIGIYAWKENDWFRKNNLYFTKKKRLRLHISKQMKSKAPYIGFKLPYTNNAKQTITDIVKLIGEEIQVNICGTVSYQLSINEEQMVIYIFFN